MENYVGIDISKKTFNVYFSKDGKESQLSLLQDKKDYQVLLHLIGNEKICVMEATGNYHLKLANFLHKNGIKVVVENPLKIKRFSQMNLQRTKTDKADAKIIYEYGKLILKDKAHFWSPGNKQIMKLKQYDTIRRQFNKQLTALSNTLEAMEHLSQLEKEVETVLKDMIKQIEKTLSQLDKKMLELVKTNYKDIFGLITSIPGVGQKTATMLICLTDGFNRFSPDQLKQFVSYIGMSPRAYESGTSVKGVAHISKIGNGKIRSLLYMCSWTAKKYNPQCVALYERLSGKGKPERVIKVAIAHKLLRQVFGVIKHGTPFSAETA